MDGKEKTYGGPVGPDAMYVKSVSSDGHEFIVKKEHELTSETVKAMLSGPSQFAENETNVVLLERSLHVCYQKYACISPTSFIPWRFLNSQLHLKLPWYC